jgi:hypothetical protein
MSEDSMFGAAGQSPASREPVFPAADTTDVLSFGGPDAAPSPARRPGRVLLVSGVAVAAAIAIVAVVLASISSGPPATPAEELAAATHASAALNSESATLTEQLGLLGSIHGTFGVQRRPVLESAAITEAVAGQTVRVAMILTKSDVYLKLGKAGGLPGAPAGKWIKVPLTGQATSSVQSLLQSVSGQNPMTEMAMLAAGDHLRAAGTATVDGVPTTRYTGSLSVPNALKHLPASTRALLGGALKMINGDIQFSVWIDGSHLIRKLTETESIESVTAHVTTTYYGFNQPLVAKVPAAGQVTGMPAGAGLSGA